MQNCCQEAIKETRAVNNIIGQLFSKVIKDTIKRYIGHIIGED